MKRIIGIITLLLVMTGCASVPMAPKEEDTAKKQFNAPSSTSSGLYIYRNMALGGALKKGVYINDEVIGKTAPMTFFYKEVSPGEHKISTESEFGLNHLDIKTEGGKNYFIRQYIKMGLFVGGSALEQITEEEGRKGVLECNLAQEQVANVK